MKEDYGASLRILLAVCSLVLLIACANIANLLLARGTSRRAQMSIRLALGASRRRLVRQSLTESLVLSVLGGILGLIVAYVGVKAIVAPTFQHGRYVPISATPSLPVLAFAFAISLLTGVLFGVAPAWFTSHVDPAEALRGANRSTRDRATFSQKALVVVQATLAVVLLAGAGLLTKRQHQNFGYEVDNRVVISLTAPYSSYPPEKLDPYIANCRIACPISPASNAQRSPSMLLCRTTGARSSYVRVTVCPAWTNKSVRPGTMSASAISRPWASRS
jgi:hypothetical protein